MTVKPAPKTAFETTVCTRCRGTGNYSYCTMYGTTCFKCGGAGHYITKRGQAAHNWMMKKREIRMGDVVVGQRVYIRGVGRFNVVAAGFCQSWATNNITGERRQMYEIRGAKIGGYVATVDAIIHIVPSPEVAAEQIAEAVAYQATLTKSGAPRKN